MLFKSKSSVIELTPKNFIIKTKKITHPTLKNKKGMIVFAASWCPHCVHFAPVYQQISNLLGSSFPLFYLDSVKYSDLASKLGIQGYPTIKYIDRNGIMYRDYKGNRDADSVLNDICKEAYVCSTIK